MTNIQSKLLNTAACTCQEFQHPWTSSCVNATAGILLATAPYSLRIYTIVYALSLVMRHRIPRVDDLKKTIAGILKSSAFLITNGYTFIMYNCLIRNLLGRYNALTAAFLPAFLASLTAIVVERPTRRPLLALYVSNVATETLWHMAEARGLVRSIPYGQAAIFGVSISVLLYLYRLGLHKTSSKDSLFDILRIFVGKPEEGPLRKPADPLAGVENVDRSTAGRRVSRPPLDFRSVAGLVQVYARFIDSLKTKHPSCPHREACISYAIVGGLKPFVGGVSLQLALKVLMNIRKIVQFKLDVRKTFLDRSTLKLGVFLGSFSFLYRAVSCVLRHGFGRDDPRFAIPAGLIGSVAFTQYPDVTVALYVMWKMLQIVYNLGIEKGVVPKVSGFTIILYCFSTAMLFHAGILEPNSLRPSYYKFLQSLSGGRLGNFNFEPFDVFGLNTSQSQLEVLRRLNYLPLKAPSYQI